MSAEFRSLVELALSAPITNPKLIMSCVDDDPEPGDLHNWSNDVDSLVAAFESQGECLLGLRSEGDQHPWANKTGMISWGAFLCIDQDGPAEELVVDFAENEVMAEIHNVWTEQVQFI